MPSLKQLGPENRKQRNTHAHTQRAEEKAEAERKVPSQNYIQIEENDDDSSKGKQQGLVRRRWPWETYFPIHQGRAGPILARGAPMLDLMTDAWC